MRNHFEFSCCLLRLHADCMQFKAAFECHCCTSSTFRRTNFDTLLPSPLAMNSRLVELVLSHPSFYKCHSRLVASCPWCCYCWVLPDCKQQFSLGSQLPMELKFIIIWLVSQIFMLLFTFKHILFQSYLLHPSSFICIPYHPRSNLSNQYLHNCLALFAVCHRPLGQGFVNDWNIIDCLQITRD